MGRSNLRSSLYTFRSLITLAILLMIAFASSNAWGADASPSPTFTLVGPVLKLEPGAKEGQATMLLKAVGLDKTAKENPTPPEIIDQKIPSPPSVNVIFSAKEMQVTDSSRSWLLSADIKELPANSSQKRYLLVRFAGLERTLDYTLTNKYDTAFSWTLKPPPSAISIQSGDAIEIGIAVGPVPASDVKLLQAALIEQSQKYPLAEVGLMLCKNSSGKCENEINLSANSANRLWLRTEANSYPAGQFQGSVTIAASQKPEGDAINLTVYASQLWKQFLGVLVIFFGVLMSWAISTYARPLLSRDQLLLTLVAVRDKFQNLNAILENKPADIDSAQIVNTRNKLVTLLDDLTEGALDSKGYLPDIPQLPFVGTAPRLDEFKQFRQKMDDWAVALDEIISRGLVRAWGKFTTYPSKKDEIKRAVETLDGFTNVPDAPAVDALKTKIDGVLNSLFSSLGTPPSGLTSPPSPTAKKENTYRMLKLEIHLVSNIVWLVMGLLTTMVGSYIVVFTKLGFGLWSDYLLCLFWGFGIPVGGQQLLQLTSTSVSTTLGISGTK